MFETLKQFAHTQIDTTRAVALTESKLLGWQLPFDGKFQMNRSGATILSPEVWQQYSDCIELLINLSLVEKKNNRLVLRGVAFYESLDDFLENSDLLDKHRHILEYIASHPEQNYLEAFVYADFIKHTSVTLLNALLFLQKTTLPQDSQYDTALERVRSLVEATVENWYAFASGQNTPQNMQLAHALSTHIKEFTSLYTQLPRKSFRLAECSNPLRMVSTALAIAKHHPTPDWIIGLPAGGTEAAFVLQYVYKQKHTQVPVHLVAASTFHSKIETNTQDLLYHQLSSIPQGSEGIIVDDNTATGNTLRHLKKALSEQGFPDIPAYVIEADIKRSRLKLQRNNHTTLPELSFLTFHSGILPVTASDHPAGHYRAGSNVINESGRTHLARALEQEARSYLPLSSHHTYLSARRHLLQYPSSRLVRKAVAENSPYTVFRGSFLSNFWPVSIRYENKTFPTVEHAYQWTKFSHLDSTFIPTDLDVSDILEEEYIHLSFSEIFQNPNITPGQIKHLSLRLSPLIRADWSRALKLEIMTELVLKKFQDPELQAALLATDHHVLIEGNTWDDVFWGMSIDARTNNTDNKPQLTEGLNMLGRILMTVRDQLQQKQRVYSKQ